MNIESYHGEYAASHADLTVSVADMIA